MSDLAYFTASALVVKDGKKQIVGLPKAWSLFSKQRCKEHQDPTHKVKCVRTGLINNITAWDFDSDEAYASAVQEYPPFAKAYTIKSPNGYHAYCKYNPRHKTTTNTKNKIDIRNDGAMIFGLGTKREDGQEYKLHYNGSKDIEIPDEVYDKFFNPQHEQVAVAIDDIAQNVIVDDATPIINSTQHSVSHTDLSKRFAGLIAHKYIDNYSDWIKIVWAMRSCGIDEAFAIELSKKSNKYDYEGFNKIWGNNGQDSVGIGTLKFYARLSNEYEFLNILAQVDNYPECIKDPDDIGVAKKIIEILSDDIIVQDDEMYIYAGDRWTLDTSGNLTKKIINSVLTKYVDIHLQNIRNEIATADDDMCAMLNKKYKKFMEAKKKFNMVGNLNLYVKAIAIELAKIGGRIEFDERPYLFMFNNKCWDFKTEGWVQPSKYDYILTTTEYDWREPTDEESEEIDKLIKQIFPDEGIRTTYLSLLYNGMIGINPERFVVANGSGGNGKGVINELFLNMVGGYGCKGNINIITKPMKEGGNPELAKIHNMRIVICQEASDGVEYDNGAIKEITGGESCDARFLYSNKTKCLLKCLLISEVNVRPRFNGKIGTDIGRRFADILFEALFTNDKELLNNPILSNVYPKDSRFKSKEFKNTHRYALFKYLIKNAPKEITIDDRTAERSASYIEDNDDFYSWFKEHYERKDDAPYLKCKDMYYEYQNSREYRLLSKKEQRQKTYKAFLYDIQTHNKISKFYIDNKKIDKKKINSSLKGWVKKCENIVIDEESDEEEPEDI